MKNFLITLFWKQNKHHKHSVLIHTLKVVYHCFKRKNYKMIPTAFLHDIGKPFVAYQKEEDKINNEYSFTNHEEKSYQIIKNIPFISKYTKDLVRYHYLIRKIDKSREKNDFNDLNKCLKIWNNLDENFKKDLKEFQICDDLGKK